uniref:Fe2OG dioxygenase domain-containing protein n=1 Tax=Strigamia maritima TaxID=126957 RepID=T1IYE7_STRMM
MAVCFNLSKSGSPDLSRVIHFNLTDHDAQKYEFEVYPLNYEMKHADIEEIGLLFIVNPFTAAGQRYWIQRCYLDYPNSPNVTNLTGKKHIWSKNDVHTWKYLRWTTLGYHHNWDTKVYSLDHHTPFPADLASLNAFFAKILQFPPYFAEAAIVNYYHLDSTLAGHVDRSEFDLEAPLFSISFGSPAIFLLGGQTKSEEPSAMMLNSGDVVVMSGQSRLSYHAVPKILSSEATPWLELENHEQERPEWIHVKKVICQSRINLNVRQAQTETISKSLLTT